MLSDNWKKEAIVRFPEFTEENYELWETPYLCWFDLRNLFEQAYKPPKNEDLIKRIYTYYVWCCNQPRGKTAEDDLVTCVAVCFLEHIPQIEEAMNDMPRWFSRDDIIMAEQTFSYHVGKEGYKEILVVYDRYEKNNLTSRSSRRANRRRS